MSTTQLNALNKKMFGVRLQDLLIIFVFIGIIAALFISKTLHAKQVKSQLIVLNIAAELSHNLTAAHIQWLTHSDGQSLSINNLSGYRNNNLDFNGFGWPTGINEVVNANNTQNVSCQEVLQALMTAHLQNNVTHSHYDQEKNFCRYSLKNSIAYINYDLTNGNVKVDF